MFDENCLKAFENIKRKISHSSSYGSTRCGKPFELMCNANDSAVGTIIGERFEKIFWAIHYASKTLNRAQLNYTTTENEMLVVVFACDKF